MAAVLVQLGWPGALDAQEVAAPMLSGTAFVGDTVMSDGMVVLHHLTDGSQGQLDSLRLGRGGTFTFRLPGAPDPNRGDLYFASVRHDGVLYFGPAITEVAQLDSVYEVHAYDTTVAPADGASLPIEARSLFFEPDSAGWRVTELYQVRNDGDHTIVARPGGRVWSHPLPTEATQVMAGEGELSFGAAEYEGGELVVRAALPPGQRLFVVRYRLDAIDITIPNPEPVEAVDLLIREPAPPLEVSELELLDRVELEAGSTYLRFTGASVADPAFHIVLTEEASPPRVEWVALVLALVLGMGGLLVLRPRPGTPAEAAPPPDREALLYEVAVLDEDFAARTSPTAEEQRAYRKRRASLIRRIRDVS